jgi:cobalt/nickel transport system permease protein
VSQAASPPLRKHSRVLENILRALSETLERALFAEEICRNSGLLQGLDARVKVIGTLALLIAVNLSRNLWVILGLYGLVFALALASAVPADFFIRRVWLALPFFTGALILPALFITPGPTLIDLPLGLFITRTGLMTALFLLLRVSTSVSLALLLILTTSWNTVLSALGVLRVPAVFILILGMTYRYIYLLLHTANDMFLSRQSRTVGRLTDADARRTLASISAALLGKSLNLGSEVYLAMVSRGYRGTVVTLQPFHMRRRDWAWLAAYLLAAAAAVFLGRV